MLAHTVHDRFEIVAADGFFSLRKVANDETEVAL